MSTTLTDTTAPATEAGDFNTPLVELRITTEIKAAKGRGCVTYGKWTAELTFGDERKGISATDEHQTIYTRGAVLAAVAGLSALKRRCAVQLITDSEYLLSGATTWLPLNLSLGWHTGPKAARIRNHDLWGQLRDVAARHDIQWIGPRNLSKGEFGGVMPNIPTEVWRRTIGKGQDTGYLYCGNVAPWHDSLGEYRAFTDTEMGNPGICVNVGSTDDNAVTPLTAKEKQARKRVIARIAKHYRPEHIHPAPREAPPPTPDAAPITLEPSKVRQIFAAFESPAGTITLLKYPRADGRFRYPTARTARLEIGVEQ